MDAYRYFKPLRNKLKQFTSESLIELCALKLHELKGFPVDEVKMYPPWFLLALIKWAVLCEDLAHPKRRHATVRDLANLQPMLHSIFDAAPVPRGPGALLLFLKNMAFQQLWLQDRLAGADFGRQIVLFEELPGTPLIRNLFFDITGLDISTYTELTSALACRFLTEDSIYVGPAYFQPLGYPADTIRRFLSMFSLERKELRSFFEEEDGRIKNFEIKLYEQTPLKKRPLLLLDDGSNYLCYSPDLLFFALSTFAYDKLKERHPEVFSAEFGKVFERYIRKGLEYAEIEFLDEAALKQKYPNSLVVDFQISSEDELILIESKAVEISPYARVSSDPRVVSGNLRDSVTKAIKQGFATATNFLGEQGLGGARAKEIFLLIVTYKDLFIGNGGDFLLNTPAKEEIERFIVERDLDPRALEFDRVFFLSVREFDRLLHVVKHQKIGLGTILAQILEANRSEKKLQFGQHLRGLYKSTFPDFVNQAYEVIITRITEKLCAARA
jgi:hypothetical protein